MRRIPSLIIIISFFFTGWSCLGGPDDGISTGGPSRSVLISTTFEQNGNFTLSGWSVMEPELSSFITATTETPGASSQYAVRLQTDTVRNAAPGLTTTAIAKNADGVSAYVIEVWAKGKGTLQVRQRTPDGPRSETFTINTSLWYHHTLTSFTTRKVADTLTFTFRPFDTDPVSYVLIDNVSVTYMRSN